MRQIRKRRHGSGRQPAPLPTPGSRHRARPSGGPAAARDHAPPAGCGSAPCPYLPVLLTRRAGALDDLLPCQREDPELWFSEQPADLEQAKVHCRRCPVRGFCLSGAVERHEPYGVWGGEIFHHGTITAQKKARGRPRAKVA